MAFSSLLLKSWCLLLVFVGYGSWKEYLPGRIKSFFDTSERSSIFKLEHIVFRPATQTDLFVRNTTDSVDAQSLSKIRSCDISILRIPKLQDNPQLYIQHLRNHGLPSMIDWTPKTVSVPDVADRESVINLAKMAADAYIPLPENGDWLNTSKRWDHDHGFGWEDVGVRGYVFLSGKGDRNEPGTVLIAIKGTSTGIFDDGGPTAPLDKLNDNVMFSCCCAKISYLWSPVCDCHMKQKHCDEQCLENELWRDDYYYRAALDIYVETRRMYPRANIWLTGHSLGGVLASLVGRTFGVPAVTFQAPGDRFVTERLHLPTPPGIPEQEEFIWHFGHTADPIFTGDCTGPGSTCWVKGYAVETKCHTGKVCVYDTIKDFGWRQSVANHRIRTVIREVLEAYDDVAECVTPLPCTDCEEWVYVNPLDDPTDVSSTSSAPPPTTTSTSDEPSPTISTSCEGRNWVGLCTHWVTITLHEYRKNRLPLKTS